MAINFVVEDGTGKSDATSYATVDQYRQYWLDRGTNVSTTSDSTIQGKLNLATEYIDQNYTFAGYVKEEDQSLSWPRYNVYNKRGYYVDDNSVPAQIIKATCYMAAQDNLQFIDENIQSESYGPVSTTYRLGKTKYTTVDSLIRELTNKTKISRVN